MSTPPAPRVFLSHSHRDKALARRLVRALSAHGIPVWLDERELPIGAALTSTISREIEGADVVLVLATNASAESKWVGLELELAQKCSKPIIPMFVDSLDAHPRFEDYLGVDATSPQTFAKVLQRLMRDLLQSTDRELPQPDPVVLEAGLRALAREDPALAPLILGCLDSEGLHRENADAMRGVSFHALDEAVNALYELKPDSTSAQHAAQAFLEAGAGVRALAQWIDTPSDGELPLVTAVGSTALDPHLLPTAIELLAACNPPNNQALYGFIARNSARFDAACRKAVIRLVTWPVRADTDRLGDVLGWVAAKHLPESEEIRATWIRWIHAGSFDGRPSSSKDLARYLKDARDERLPGWDRVEEALRSHVRHFLRSGDKTQVVRALEHLQAAADEGAPVLETLLREAHGVSGTAEWNEWSRRDPETAEFLGWYAHSVVEEATGERNWLRAWKSAEKMVEFEQLRRQVFEQEETEPEEDG